MTTGTKTGTKAEGTPGETAAEPSAHQGEDTATAGSATSTSTSAAAARAADAEMTAVVDLLVRGLRALGGAGHVDQASRLAGQAWSVLRTNHERSADRLNGLLHYLARLPDTEAHSGPHPSTEE